VADVKRPVVLRIERYASAEEYKQIVDALVDNAEEASAISETVTVVDSSFGKG
jgi:hypothetical protein